MIRSSGCMHFKFVYLQSLPDYGRCYFLLSNPPTGSSSPSIGYYLGPAECWTRGVLSFRPDPGGLAVVHPQATKTEEGEEPDDPDPRSLVNWCF